MGTIAVIGGTIVNESWSGPATVLAEDGVIVSLQASGDSLPTDLDQVIDAHEMLVLPGGVDPHCHVDTQVGGFRTRDDYLGASEAALWGGTTTIVDFAIPVPGQSPLGAVAERVPRIAEARCDVALHGCVIEWIEETAAQLAEMASLGVRTIKLFTTYRDVLMASPDTVLRVMRQLTELGGLAYVHAESNQMVEAAQAIRVERKEISAKHHGSTRPEPSEVSAVEEVLTIAESVGAPVYFVHQSTPAAVHAVTDARSRGVWAFSETCPHYLVLSEENYQHDEPERFVCCPPLRSKESVEGLRTKTLRGEVHAVGSDHNCFDRDQKLENRDDVRQMPNGLPGVETRLPLMYSELVGNAGMDASTLVRLLCANPAKLNGIYPRKGVIAVGSDADLVVLDPNEERSITAQSLHMRTDYSPYEDRMVVGWPRSVIVGGEVAIEDGEWQAFERTGRFLESNRLNNTHPLLDSVDR